MGSQSLNSMPMFYLNLLGVVQWASIALPIGHSCETDLRVLSA
jgi:hypothetical protein